MHDVLACGVIHTATDRDAFTLVSVASCVHGHAVTHVVETAKPWMPSGTPPVVAVPPRIGRKLIWTEERNTDLAQAWNAGVPTNTLCTRFGVKHATLVWQINQLRRNGMALRERRGKHHRGTRKPTAGGQLAHALAAAGAFKRSEFAV
ncbi:MAG TPA: hypothetical protein VEA38_14385 [Terriglobales bacterium]|nr:hypothetical protein [Terriglobales bacterium]